MTVISRSSSRSCPDCAIVWVWSYQGAPAEVCEGRCPECHRGLIEDTHIIHDDFRVEHRRTAWPSHQKPRDNTNRR